MLFRSLLAGLLACLLSSAALAQADLVTPKDVTDSAVPRMVPFCPVGATGKYAPCSSTNPLPTTGGGGGVSTVTGSQEQDFRSSASLSAATLNGAVKIDLNGQSTVGFTFTGLTASGATLTYEQSNDGGTTWTGINEVNAGTGVPAATRTTDGQTRVSVSGRTNIRVRVSAVGTGTITLAYSVSVREGIMTLGSPLPPGANDIGGVNVATDGAASRKLLTTPQGAVEPPTAGSGKITRTSTSLTASTSTTIVPANANRIGVGIQCAAGGVSVDETGAALTAAGVGSGTLFIPTGTGPYFTPPVATRTAITAFSATGQTCVVTEYLR